MIGDAVHAWMVAARLARDLRRHEVRIVLLEDAPGPGPGILCLDPDIHAFHRSLGVGLEDLLRHLRAGLRYGTQFVDWAGAGRSGFAPFGDAGQMIERVPFQHYVTALRAVRGDARLADFAPAALAARAGRFGTGGRGPLAGLEAGLSVERSDYLAFLRALGTDLGVQHVPGVVQQVQYDADGHAQAVLLEDGQTLSADGFFDCSQNARLASVGGSTARHAFPARVGVTRREFRRARLDGPAPLVDQVVRRDDGWERFRCVADSVEAERVWTAGPDDDASAPGAHGWLRAPWQGRCVALGPALGEPEDLVVDRWRLTRRAIAHWLRLLPGREPCPKLRDEFNRVVVAEARRLADAQGLPLLCAADRTPDAAARVRIDEAAAADLRYRMMLYRAGGRLAFHEEDPLDAPRWMMLLEAMHVLAGAADRLLPAMAPEELARRMERVGASLAQAVAGLPAHAQALARLRQAEGAVP
ncbi:tryptophan 7-halogenase [Arenimonas sp. MALMAid1274]|uniref:tryptophan 7-halogenase n=1 Tax=Arenimonas sp. MALMAid1274 TaxID=3411630 RepID=UPI003BA3211D